MRDTRLKGREKREEQESRKQSQDVHRPGEEGDQIPNRDMSEAQEGKPFCRGQKIP